MQLLTTALLIAGALAIPVRDATCNAAQNDATHQCLASFYSFFGPPSPFNWVNFQAAYFAQITTVDQFTAMCTQHNKIDPCAAASSANVSVCLTPSAFTGWFGTSNQDSLDFRTAYFDWSYECNAGFDIVTSNFQCLSTIRQFDNTQMNSCRSIFNAALQNGTEYCTAYNNYIGCVDQVYTSFCGPQVKPWICNMEEIGLEVNYAGCNSVLQGC